MKFTAVRSGVAAEGDSGRLLDACEAAAASRGVLRLLAGVNTARHEAYRYLLGRGFRTDLQGIVMQRDNDPGYNLPGVWLLDDGR